MASSFSTLVSLVLALTIGISSALPLRQPRDSSVSIQVVFSQKTGTYLHVHEDGNVTAKDRDEFTVGRFIVRQSGNKFLFQSVDFNGSFLHFSQVINVNGSSNATSNGTKISTDSTISNDTTIVLQIGALAPNDSETDSIQHHQWVEEVDADGFFRYFSVVLEDGKICYLAFEEDGKPVDDPCQHRDELSTKARFGLLPVSFIPKK